MSQRQTRLGFVIAGLLFGIFISAMDNTVVATATGSIVAHLGGIDKIVWITAAYLVTEMAGMPIFGKLSDMYGRKRFFVFGVIMFLVGSMLCGTAQNMDQLAIYRAIQGIGGGALMPIAFTIIFDVVPREQAGKFSGMFGAVFGLASIFGPLLGAYITDHINWRWVFYINVPVGIVTLLLIIPFYHESRQHHKQSIDWGGIIVLVPAILCLMFGLELGGNKFAWGSVEIIGLFCASVVLFAAFLLIERKAKDPIISFSMFKKRVFAGSNLVGLFSGSAYIVAVIYIPIYIQGVLGGSATNAGLELLPMMIGTSVTAPIAGSLANKMSYRSILFGSSIVFIFGIVMLTTLNVHSSVWQVMSYMAIVGLGIGPSFSVVGMAAMHHFDERQRGAASSTNSFVRELGMTVGITVFGVIQKDLFANSVNQKLSSMGSAAAKLAQMDPHAMLQPTTRAHIPAAILSKLSAALSASVTHTMVWDLIPAVLALLVVFWIGSARFQGIKRSSDLMPEVE